MGGMATSLHHPPRIPIRKRQTSLHTTTAALGLVLLLAVMLIMVAPAEPVEAQSYSVGSSIELVEGFGLSSCGSLCYSALYTTRGGQALYATFNSTDFGGGPHSEQWVFHMDDFRSSYASFSTTPDSFNMIDVGVSITIGDSIWYSDRCIFEADGRDLTCWDECAMIRAQCWPYVDSLIPSYDVASGEGTAIFGATRITVVFVSVINERNVGCWYSDNTNCISGYAYEAGVWSVYDHAAFDPCSADNTYTEFLTEYGTPSAVLTAILVCTDNQITAILQSDDLFCTLTVFSVFPACSRGGIPLDDDDDDDAGCPDFNRNGICDDTETNIAEGFLDSDDVVLCDYLPDDLCDAINDGLASDAEPCDVNYVGTYDAWFRQQVTAETEFDNSPSTQSFTGMYHFHSPGGSGSAAGGVLPGPPAAGSDYFFAGVGYGYGTPLVGCHVAVIFLDDGTGIDGMLNISIPEGSSDDHQRHLSAFSSEPVNFGMCFFTLDECDDGGTMIASCTESTYIIHTSGATPRMSWVCALRISDFEWDDFLDEFETDIPQFRFNNEPITSDYTISDSANRFWECFQGGSTGGYDFSSITAYSTYNYINTVGNAWWRNIPIVGTAVSSTLDIMKGIPCGMYRLFIPERSALVGITQGAQECSVDGDSLICADYNFAAHHLYLWSSAMEGTLGCEGVSLEGIFALPVFENLAGDGSTEKSREGREALASARLFSLCDTDEEADFLNEHIHLIRPVISIAVILLLMLGTFAIIRGMIEKL